MDLWCKFQQHGTFLFCLWYDLAKLYYTLQEQTNIEHHKHKRRAIRRVVFRPLRRAGSFLNFEEEANENAQEDADMNEDVDEDEDEDDDGGEVERVPEQNGDDGEDGEEEEEDDDDDE